MSYETTKARCGQNAVLPNVNAGDAYYSKYCSFKNLTVTV
jgi:hypothetical protein